MKPFKIISFALIISILLCTFSNIDVKAASLNVSQLNAIHGRSDKPDTIKAMINEISTSTGADVQNDKGEWLNPYVYDDYGLIIYGLPTGDFYERSDGKTYKNGKEGEYKYLGYSGSSFLITNDRFFSGGSPGTKFMSAEDYKKVKWQTQEGAPSSWENLTQSQRKVIAERTFYDDDYGGPPDTLNEYDEIAGLTLYGLLGDSIREKALVQVAPTMWSVKGSVRLRYNSTNWNTLIFRPLAPDTDVSAEISSQDVFVMEENMDSITVPYTVSGIIDGDAVKQDMMQNLDKLSFNSNQVTKDVNLSAGSSPTQSVKYDRNFARATLKVGENKRMLSAVANLTTKYKTDTPLRATADKEITIIVKAKKIPPTEGAVFVRYINSETDAEIPELAWDFTLKFGEKKTVSGLPVPSGFEKCEGSYGKYYADTSSNVIPPTKKDMKPETSLEITLTQSYKVAYVYFWYKVKPGETPKPPVKINYDPIAIIKNPPIVYAGDDVLIDGSSSYDTDGVIERYIWELPGTDGCDPDNPWFNVLNNGEQDIAKGSVWYPKVGLYDIDLEVVDDGGCTGYDRSTIQVIEPIPSISIDVIAEKMKENRKITLDLSKSKASKRFPIDWSLTTWKIEPVSGTGASGDYGVRLENGTVYKNVNGNAKLYSNGFWADTGSSINNVLRGQKSVQFQARDSGQYKISVSIINTSIFNNSVHYSNAIDRTITIVEDLPPIASFSGSSKNVREFENPLDKTLQKYSIIPIHCTTISPDGDPIGKRFWTARYDSDNDCNNGLSIFEAYNDEQDIYPYDGDRSEPFTNSTRLMVDGEYDSMVEIWTYAVGMFTESLLAYEDIPGNETVKELLLPGDYRSDYVQGW